MTEAFSAVGLTKRFDGRAVVDDVSLTLEPGTVTALVGGSGAGKTTLLRLFAGMERPDAGEIRISERVLSSPRGVVAPEDRETGLIFQDFALFPNMTVLKNIMFGLHRSARNERAAIAENWIGRLNLSHRRDAYPHQLSGGEQQRVAIARALAPQPVAMLMDEPFSGLDPALRRQARAETMAALAQSGTPTLIVTHDAEEAFRVADRIAVIQQGKLLQCDTPQIVYTSPATPAVAAALGPVQKFAVGALPDEWQSLVGKAANVWIRPEALQLDPKSRVLAKVKNVRFVGAATEIEIVVGNAALTMLAPHLRQVDIGDEVAVSLSPEGVMSFDGG